MSTNAGRDEADAPAGGQARPARPAATSADLRRRRRFWQGVLAVELVVALVVALVG